MPDEYVPRAAPADQFVALLISLLNIALRPQRKAISAEIADRLYAHLRDATAGGDPIYDLLTDLLEQPAMPRVTQVFERESAYGDPQFERWRQQRYEDTR